MFDDILDKILDITEKNKTANVTDDIWDTGQESATWTVFDTPSKDMIWTSDSNS